MDYFVYILKSELNGQYYIGQTQNLENRVTKHNNKEVKSTARNAPWVIIHSEKFDNRKEAMKREKQIKAWKSRKMIEKRFVSISFYCKRP
jgi:putative endonuclease